VPEVSRDNTTSAVSWQMEMLGDPRGPICVMSHAASM